MISCGSIYVNGKCDISIMPMRSDALSAVFPPDCVDDHSISASVPEVYANGHEVEIAHHNNQDRIDEFNQCYKDWLNSSFFLPWMITSHIEICAMYKMIQKWNTPLSKKSNSLTAFNHLECNETNLRQHKCREQDRRPLFAEQDLKLTFRKPVCRTKIR